jgi:hypothetical protein
MTFAPIAFAEFPLKNAALRNFSRMTARLESPATVLVVLPGRPLTAAEAPSGDAALAASGAIESAVSRQATVFRSHRFTLCFSTGSPTNGQTYAAFDGHGATPVSPDSDDWRRQARLGPPLGDLQTNAT